jgi:adenosylcobinamide-phosphate synthase
LWLQGEGAVERPSAYLDPALNYIPARIAGVLILVAGSFKGRQLLAHGFRILNINARWPIKALASALDVRLEKLGHYSAGERRGGVWRWRPGPCSSGR